MDVELGLYLCPNDLFLGRASNRVPSGSWSTSDNTKKRLDFIQKIVGHCGQSGKKIIFLHLSLGKSGTQVKEMYNPMILFS